MAERKAGLWSLLAHPWVYETFQAVLGADRGRRRFVAEDLKPQAGDRVLDIGCGTARLAGYLGPVTYVGFEPNADYVAQGRVENVGRDVTLHAGYFDAAAAENLPPFDLVIVSAVLHHMDDGQAEELFTLLPRVTKPGGRVVTLDNVYVDGQDPIAKAIIRMDRGQSIRDPEGYAVFARRHFAKVIGRVIHQRWIPYTYWIMECRDPILPAKAASGS